MAAKTLAIMNQKGGVGKTTTTVNVGAVLAKEYGRRVLLVDLDPQANMSDHVGLDPNLTEQSIYDVITGGMEARAVIRQVQGMAALPANLDLSGAEIELAGTERWADRLREALLPVKDDYDFILMDCPPSLGVLTVSGLAAADTVLVAMEAEYLALRGISQLVQTVRKVGESLNPGLEVGGVLFCMFDGRTTLAREVRDEVERYFPGKVFSTAVRKNVRLAEAPSRGLTILEYEPNCAGADDYREVAREFVQRFDSEIVDVEGDIMAATPVIRTDN